MNWFKHDADATQDAKIKKLLIRHGAVGYAIYFHCLELIAAEVSESNLTFELEHDSEIIADNLHIHGTAGMSGIQIVEDIMRYIIELGLFEESNDRIFCFKLLKRMDLSMTSNPNFRKLIAAAKENHDAVMMGHDDVMTRHDSIMRASKPNKQEKQEEETPAREEQPPQQNEEPAGAPAAYHEDETAVPQFKIASYWFRKYNQVTGLTLMPDERANLLGKELLSLLGGNIALAQRAVDYYFDHWRELWFACKRASKDTPMDRRQWAFSFMSFVKNIQEILSLMQNAAPAKKNQTERWCSADVFGQEEIPEAERKENAQKLSAFIASLEARRAPALSPR